MSPSYHDYIPGDFTPAETFAASEMNDMGRKIEVQVYGHVDRALAHHYVLDANNVAVPCGMGTWAVWTERDHRGGNARCRVGNDEWTDPKGLIVEVSTVFLGLDHGHGGVRKLFESMVFVNRHKVIAWLTAHREGVADGRSRINWLNETTYRYSTWPQADAGHKRLVELAHLALRGEITEDDLWSAMDAKRRIDL